MISSVRSDDLFLSLSCFSFSLTFCDMNPQFDRVQSLYYNASFMLILLDIALRRKA